ncbi:glycosyltransferase [Hassallia byssoidea VB512170]|uniref:Glycosyltransferase n=1 Tax=Hassallia byssoidea VB512170 TaxID=1304833 RepID=A0A846H395_9CYAN|nr:glycosyltransferase [Hassalia byssoidea]NEU71852.1 glycosyltransferase [Hassalia byssoidea VB512170]
MKISIITATYNRPSQLSAMARSARALAIALPSILNQIDNQFEWIIVNDGGDPETREISAQLQTS